MKETVNPFDVMSSASYSTYSFLLQNITHYAISKKLIKQFGKYYRDLKIIQLKFQISIQPYLQVRSIV